MTTTQNKAMTAQQIFNKVVKHLRKQGKKTPKKSFAGVKMCQYKSANGTKCAVGCLISEREYKTEMEGNSVLFLTNPKVDCYSPALATKIGSNLDLAQDLQSIHDNYSVREWEKKFTTVAAEYLLTVPKK